MNGMRFVVKGRVQGVYFRASTRERALALGLTGQAVNRADGSVEVTVCGESGALAALEQWLHQGPPAARVTSVAAQAWVDAEPVPQGFRVG